MARYSRVALYNKAKNATHNHPTLIPTHYQKEIVQIPEAKNEPVDFLHKQEDKKEKLLKPVAENLTTEKETKMSAKVKRSAKKSASAKPKKKVVAKKVLTVAKKSVKKALPVKAKKVAAKPKAKKSMVSKKPVKKSAKKTSSKKMSMKKPVKKMAGSNKKNTKPVLKRQTKKSK